MIRALVSGLNDKNTLSKVITQIEAYVDEQKWITKANKALGSLKTNGVTLKQGELFDKYVTIQYEKVFAEECKKLKVPVAIKISQRNAKGQTLRKLQISSTNVSHVLSEGEQRATCLADFLTEAQLDPLCCGAIFDDPVTSLDHERREDIAKRLVELAGAKQVVVFTHDIAFLHRLTALFDAVYGREPTVVTLRRFSGRIGIIEPDLPWVAQPVGKRIKYLRNKLVALQKIEKAQSQDDYIVAAKAWYGLLREGWERAVEERLLKGVVERFKPEIQTQKLRKLHIDPQYLTDIETGMTDCSKWVHDAAAGLNPTIPDTVKATEDLARFEKFADKCVAP
jgi:ABC-type lipoprotein export system ATPase subunit